MTLNFLDELTNIKLGGPVSKNFCERLIVVASSIGFAYLLIEMAGQLRSMRRGLPSGFVDYRPCKQNLDSYLCRIVLGDEEYGPERCSVG